MGSTRLSFLQSAFATCLLLAGGCRSIEISPRALSEQPDPQHTAALAQWSHAVELANEFLDSDYRRTLPPGHFELLPEGMRFNGSERSLPIEVHSTEWGKFVVQAGFAAQERENGFVVGSQPPRKDPLLDHSFFRFGDGRLLPASSIAELTLHETTHVIYREGTVGFWNGVEYYLEAIFLFRYSNHSAERHANATSEEFEYFAADRSATAEGKALLHLKFERHLTQGPTPQCVHGGQQKDPRAGQ